MPLISAGKIIPAFMLFFFLLFSVTVNGQETSFTPEDELPPDDDFIFFEDEGITITGTRQTSQQMAVIDSEEIARRNAPDVGTLLSESLNLNIARYGPYGSQAFVNLRGLDSKRVAFLVDGLPVNSFTDGKFDISGIDPNSIERIEVIYGGSDSRYNVSGALGGVVNIITVKRQKPGLRIGGSFSNTSSMPGEYRDRNGLTQSPRWEDLLDTQNFTLFAAYGAEAFSISANIFANRAENHFIYTDFTERIRRKDNNEVFDTGASVSAVWELPNLSKIITSANFYYGDKNFPVSGISRLFGNQTDISGRQSLMLEMPRAFHDDFAADFSVAWDFNRRDYTSPADIFSRHDQYGLIAVNRWSWHPGTKFTLKSGVDYRFVYLDSSEIGNRDRHDSGIFAAAEYKPVRQFLIIPSVKTVFSSKGAAGVTAIPKLGLLWNVTDSLAFKNNYFRSFKFPDFEELYWSGGGGLGNPDLLPEDGWGGDLGISWRQSFTALESTFFTQQIRNSIHWFSGGGMWRPENVGKAAIFGLDNKIRFEIPVEMGPVKKIIPSLSYQYLLSYLLSYGYTFDSNKRIPYNPVHTVGGSLDIHWNSGSFLISGNYTGLRYHDTANITELKPHFLLNATVNQNIGENLTAFAVVRNILNTSYESFYAYPMPGITLMLGIRFNYNINTNKGE